jgi:hypothetical protein
MRPTLLCLLLWGVTAPIASAGPNAGGTLVVQDAHINFSAVQDLPVPPVSPPPSDCGAVDNNVLPSTTPIQMRVWKVYAAFPTGSCPRLRSLTWGISDLGGGSVYVTAAGLPDPINQIEIVTGGWPNPQGGGGSIAEDLAVTQSSTFVECYWFGGYCYQGGRFATKPHAYLDTQFVDDAVPVHVDPIAGFSSIGFGIAGQTVCPGASTGACCAPLGTCSLTVPADCHSPAVWQCSFSCSPNPCPLPNGACCEGSGACELSNEPDCPAPNQWLGAGSSCVPNLCVPFGACCHPDGSCLLASEALCLAGIGNWRGAAVLCDPNPCRGGCWDLLSCSCTLVVADSADAQCTHPHGPDDVRYLFLGPATTCPAQPDTVRGACCFAGGCLEMTCGECLIATGGYGFQGPWTTCETNLCAQSGAPSPPIRPVDIDLSSPAPNPVSERLTFTVTLPSAGVISVRLFDVTGALVCRLVEGTDLPDGRHEISRILLDVAGRRLPTGVYYLRLEACGTARVQKVLVAR